MNAEIVLLISATKTGSSHPSIHASSVHSFRFQFLTSHSGTSNNFSHSAYSISTYYKETLLNDIRKAREKYQGEELAKELARIKLRMDNTEVLTSDIVINLLLSYRDIQVCYQK